MANIMNDKVKDLVNNRKAYHEYEVLETFEAGIALMGTEIKSLRMGGGSIHEAYVKMIKGEVWIVGMSIPPYKFGNVHNHEEKRDRKLLLHKREIETMRRATQEKGLTVVPLSLYLKEGMAKLKIAVGRGKKLADKRETIKARDDARQMQRMKKEFG